jgi:hypothetical protein
MMHLSRNENVSIFDVREYQISDESLAIKSAYAQ